MLLSVFCVKLLISLLDQTYFHRALAAKDWWLTYSIDFSLIFAVLLLLTPLTYLALQGSGQQTLIRAQGSWPRAAYAFLTLLRWSCIALAILYGMLGYVYFEWGSSIQPHHIEAIYMAGVGPEFEALFFRWRTLFVAAGLLGLYVLAQQLMLRLSQRKLHPMRLILGFGLALSPAVLSFSGPYQSPENYAPTVQSPLLSLLGPIAENTDGIADLERLQAIDIRGYSPYSKRAVKAQYAALAGAAQGYNVVFYVMESVRRRNVPLYGYARETMPTLSTLASNALVFDNAYVMQPRSSKAMSALALGAMPDPRLRPLSWTPERINGKETLFKRLMADNRRFYIGTAQPYGGDNLQKFFSTTAGGKAQEIISFEDLAQDPDLPNDDIGLSTHFANWVAQSPQPFVGLLWTECAHMPYAPKLKPFGSLHLMDKYDNCLHQVGRGLAELVAQLRQLKQLDNTLLVIFGDHGEALGEKFDRGHGSYLYEHSMRIPFVMHNPVLFSQTRHIPARFQLKDVPATVLWLLGLSSDLNQSENIFAREADDDVYMSNVYQDYKLGMIQGHKKVIYRPRFDMSYQYDLHADPDEDKNIVGTLSSAQLKDKQIELLRWYKYQTEYIEANYPNK